jgi:hypothetical protein
MTFHRSTSLARRPLPPGMLQVAGCGGYVCLHGQQQACVSKPGRRNRHRRRQVANSAVPVHGTLPIEGAMTHTRSGKPNKSAPGRSMAQGFFYVLR